MELTVNECIMAVWTAVMHCYSSCLLQRFDAPAGDELD